MISDKDNQIFYSVASIWEIEIKHSIRPNEMRVDGKEVSSVSRVAGFNMLPIEDKHVFELSNLKRKSGTPKHNDPFDRILLAQAKAENYKFLTHDSLIADYEEDCVMTV